MIRATSCTVTLPDGEKLLRKKVLIDRNNFLIVRERRTNDVLYEQQVITVERTARNKWVVTTEDGDITVARAGCNCGG